MSNRMPREPYVDSASGRFGQRTTLAISSSTIITGTGSRSRSNREARRLRASLTRIASTVEIGRATGLSSSVSMYSVALSSCARLSTSSRRRLPWGVSHWRTSVRPRHEMQFFAAENTPSRVRAVSEYLLLRSSNCAWYGLSRNSASGSPAPGEDTQAYTSVTDTRPRAAARNRHASRSRACWEQNSFSPASPETADREVVAPSKISDSRSAEPSQWRAARTKSSGSKKNPPLVTAPGASSCGSNTHTSPTSSRTRTVSSIRSRLQLVATTRPGAFQISGIALLVVLPSRGAHRLSTLSSVPDINTCPVAHSRPRYVPYQPQSGRLLSRCSRLRARGDRVAMSLVEAICRVACAIRDVVPPV